jgi:hypothetical protein
MPEETKDEAPTNGETTGKSPHLTRKFITGLGLLFVVLKLTHVIAWSWWWVLSPFIFGVAVSLFLGVILGIAQRRERKG